MLFQVSFDWACRQIDPVKADRWVLLADYPPNTYCTQCSARLAIFWHPDTAVLASLSSIVLLYWPLLVSRALKYAKKSYSYSTTFFMSTWWVDYKKMQNGFFFKMAFWDNPHHPLWDAHPKTDKVDLKKSHHEKINFCIFFHSTH